MRQRVGFIIVMALALAGLATAGLAGPAQAVTPTVTVTTSATGDENSVFRGTGDGFTPGSTVTIAVTAGGSPYTGSYTRTRTADAAGHFTWAWVWVWDQGDPFGTYVYTATDVASGAEASATFTITRNGNPPAPEPGSGLMFDARSAPPLATMQAWISGAAYRTVGVYVPVAPGTDDRSDKQQVNLTASWVQDVRTQGWHVLPIYVGVQAPAACQDGNFYLMSNIPAEASAQGVQAGQYAAGSVAALGVPASVPVVYDLEGYRNGCSAAVSAFLDGWTVGLHAAGRLSGVYGSQASTMKDLASHLGDATYHQPDSVWVATDNRSATTTGFTSPPDGSFAGHRLNQFHLGLERTFGGATLSIDESVINDGVLTGVPPVATPAPVAGPGVVSTLLAGVSLTPTITPSWTGTAAVGVASYDVRVRKGTWRRSLSGLSYPAALQGTTATSSTVKLKPGSTFCYSVRSRDRVGVTSGWSPESCTTRPLDDRRLAARGWGRGKDRTAYDRTVTATRTQRSTLTLKRVRTDRVGLVVASGSRGSVRVTIDGKVIGSIRARSTKAQRVIWLPSTRVRTGTLVITTLTGAPVRIDGVVISST